MSVLPKIDYYTKEEFIAIQTSYESFRYELIESRLYAMVSAGTQHQRITEVSLCHIVKQGERVILYC